MLNKLNSHWLVSGLLGLGLAIVPFTITSSGAIEGTGVCANYPCHMEASSACYTGGKIMYDYVNIID